MKTLNEICEECGADKGIKHPVKGHGYAPHYDRFFDALRFDKFKFLEIGVGGGESIRSWLAYFDQAHIYGCDITQATNPWNTAGQSPNPRYTFFHGDQADPIMWACAKANFGGDWGIVVDDGGHFNNQIIITFESLWPEVVPGGYYCIEDLAAGSTPGTVFLKPGFPSHMTWLGGLIEKMNLGQNDIAEIHCSPELAILRKKA